MKSNLLIGVVGLVMVFTFVGNVVAGEMEYPSQQKLAEQERQASRERELWQNKKKEEEKQRLEEQKQFDKQFRLQQERAQKEEDERRAKEQELIQAHKKQMEEQSKQQDEQQKQQQAKAMEGMKKPFGRELSPEELTKFGNAIRQNDPKHSDSRALGGGIFANSEEDFKAGYYLARVSFNDDLGTLNFVYKHNKCIYVGYNAPNPIPSAPTKEGY